MRRLALGDPHAWLITSARYYQTLDFYTEYLDLPDEELPEAVREAVRWHWDGPLPPEEVARDIQLAEMLLLVGDRRRVWWRDLEGVFAGEEAYLSSESSCRAPRSRTARRSPTDTYHRPSPST